uniref:Uncharacterized protein n=1 Tax=Oryza sativa subsp. japonica TaxID=39947 RepID=Q6I646_ORYSJ|nr:hypothetical protein [Oryza sativa Japonica Group]
MARPSFLPSVSPFPLSARPLLPPFGSRAMDTEEQPPKPLPAFDRAPQGTDSGGRVDPLVRRNRTPVTLSPFLATGCRRSNPLPSSIPRRIRAIGSSPLVPCYLPRGSHVGATSAPPRPRPARAACSLRAMNRVTNKRVPLGTTRVSEPEDPQCEDFEDQAQDLKQGKSPLIILHL